MVNNKFVLKVSKEYFRNSDNTVLLCSELLRQAIDIPASCRELYIKVYNKPRRGAIKVDVSCGRYCIDRQKYYILGETRKTILKALSKRDRGFMYKYTFYALIERD